MTTLTTAIRNGRPPHMRNGIVRHLRRLIVTGKLVPGDQLPTYIELQAQFSAEAETVRDAIGELQQANFIETKPRRGTFVVPHPPHLSEFAMVFPMADYEEHSRFFAALRHEVLKRQAPGRRVTAFSGVESHVDVEDYQRLLGLVQTDRLAGLIFASNPHELQRIKSPLVRKPGVLRVAIMMPFPGNPFPTVYPDIDSFLPRAFDDLASRGRKRVAVLMLGVHPTASIETVQALAAERGLIFRPHWLQAASADTPNWTRQTALALLHQAQTERPDAVIITDDNLVEAFTEGIRDTGLSASDLDVVAQANFPYPTLSHVPAKRLGYDISRLMAVCLERIEQQRRGESVPAHTAIPVEFAEK